MNAIDRAERAYSAQVNPTRTPRGTEYEVFTRVTRRLRAAAEPGSPFARLAEALHDNRRLWTTLATALADDDNGLPPELRARLFYLSQFTAAHTRKVLKREASAAALIDINTSVMNGLRTAGGPQ